MNSTQSASKTRWQTLFWFTATGVVLVLLVASDTTSNADAYGRPTTENRRSPGVAALHQWLTSANISVHSQRSRLTDLPAAVTETTGHVAIVHLPGTLLYEAEEVQALLSWVAEGNTLLVAAGHLEGNRWIYEGQNLPRALWRLTGLELYLAKLDKPPGALEPEQSPAGESGIGDRIDALLEETEITPGWLQLHDSEAAVDVVPGAPHPASSALEGIKAPWDSARWSRDLEDAEIDTDDGKGTVRSWQADIDACSEHADQRALRGAGGCLVIPTPNAMDWRAVLQHRHSGQPAMLASSLQQGEVFVLLHPSLLGNEVIHRFNNRALIVGLLRHALAPGGSVLFDDAHQGLNNILESGDLLSDGRFWASVGFLLLFWIAYLLADGGHWQRAVHRAWPRRPSQQDLVHSSANFLRQRLHPTAALEALLEPLQEQLARKWQLPPDRALSQGLAQERDSHPQAVAALEALLSSARNGQTPALAKARQTITRLRQAIA